jgi:hypothetical protein
MAKSDADKARLKYGYHNFDPSIDLKRGWFYGYSS